MIEKVVLSERIEKLPGPWQPRLVADPNGQEVRLARIEGEFVWHAHEDADELFLVLDGEFDLELRDGSLHLGPGEMVCVPRGVEHRPVAQGPCHVLIFEPAGTDSAGGTGDPRGVTAPPRE